MVASQPSKIALVEAKFSSERVPGITGPIGASAADVDDTTIDAPLAGDARAQSLPPVAFVIGANDEEGAIARAVSGLPLRVYGLGARAFVVVDGATDGTADEARRGGAVVCEVPVGRGPWAALRLGYRIARGGGARSIVAIDADGQYDPAEAEFVHEPVVSGMADFVSGSRVLARDETAGSHRSKGAS